MANAFLKAEAIVRTALGLLEREIVLPRVVWRDAGGDFRGAKNDTISLRLPAYAVARTRVMRSGDPITIDELEETKVDVTLDTHVYKAIGISDEELTLDIVSFGEQVLMPAVRSVARKVEDAIADEIQNATYHSSVTMDPAEPHKAIAKGRRHLNDASVPFDGRFVAVGSALEETLLTSDQFVKADQAGDSNAFRDAQIGRVYGMPVVSVPGFDPEFGVIAHRTAFVLSSRAPIVPEGATFGSSESFADLAMRVLRDYDFTNVRDRLLTDVFVGTNTVEDTGTVDVDGKFVPAEDPDASGVEQILIRAVDISLGS